MPSTHTVCARGHIASSNAALLATSDAGREFLQALNQLADGEAKRAVKLPLLLPYDYSGPS